MSRPAALMSRRGVQRDVAPAGQTAPVEINWDAAATALLVTLTVEMFLRPGLERRKTLLTTRAEFLAELVGVSQAARVVALEVPKEATREVRENLRAEQRRQYEQMTERVRRIFDQSGRYGAAHGKLMNDIIDYAMCIHGAMLSGRPRHRKAEIIVELALPAAQVFDATIWRSIRFVSSRAELRKRIAATGFGPDSPENQAP